MSSSNCCFLLRTDLSGGRSGVWCSRLFRNLPQFGAIHTVKALAQSIKQKKMFFWNSLAFSMIQWMLVIWSLVPLPFLNPAWTSGITSTEIEAVVKNLSKNKSPVTDGFTGEFYQAFREELMTILLQLFQNISKNTSKLILRGQHHSDMKTRQKQHTKKENKGQYHWWT